jgi:hypothetical protein
MAMDESAAWIRKIGSDSHIPTQPFPKLPPLRANKALVFEVIMFVCVLRQDTCRTN